MEDAEIIHLEDFCRHLITATGFAFPEGIRAMPPHGVLGSFCAAFPQYCHDLRDRSAVGFTARSSSRQYCRGTLRASALHVYPALIRSLERTVKTSLSAIKRPLFSAALDRIRPAPRKQRWAIGIYVGTSSVSLAPAEFSKNPVLTGAAVSDVHADYVADPFMLRVNRTWYMFFEVLNRQNGRGEIGLATSTDAMTWTYRQIVLAQPFHLSYPYVFRWKSDYYMIPESFQTESIRLYKALKFPAQWAYSGTLARGRWFMDSSVVHHNGKWWLFTAAPRSAPTETRSEPRYDILRLYYADELGGPWREHPKSPIVDGNVSIARPAGRVLVNGGTVIRYAQDCDGVYGKSVRALHINDLTPNTYSEREIQGGPILTGSGKGWNRYGMHHLDPHPLGPRRWIACVDGWT
jgi:hypothetical protein